ncbi:carbohydrate kinase [Saccharopolyspora cebuensis]|uniref:Carbohydrate kinase n=1 Tax=Saccharopolyspora cebuensis TaxID=418759 RepID=A0ABV4CH96_9PSEU
MIVIGGEALVDLVPASTADGPLAPLHPRLGGGPYNVAITLGRQGIPVGFHGRISTDPLGEALLDRLTESAVDTELVQRGPEPTTLAVVGLAADGGARYSFHTRDTAAPLVRPAELPAHCTALCLGTLGLVLEPGATVYEQALFRAAEQGRFTALDPNVRAGMIADPDAYRARFESWLPAVDLLKLSEEDARWLSPDEPVVDAVRRWRDAGPRAVVLTRGGDGLLVLAGEEPVRVPAPATAVADTIGAGDTVQGSLLAWLHREGALDADALTGLDWHRALRHAAAAAAITVSRPGAEPPWSAELAPGG